MLHVQQSVHAFCLSVLSNMTRCCTCAVLFASCLPCCFYAGAAMVSAQCVSAQECFAAWTAMTAPQAHSTVSSTGLCIHVL